MNHIIVDNKVIFSGDKSSFVIWRTKAGRPIPIFGRGEKGWTSTQTKEWKKDASKRKKAGIEKRKATIAEKSQKADWKPAMTEKEAATWNKDSVEKRTFLHGTNARESIEEEGFRLTERGIYGSGVYMTNSTREAKGHGESALQIKMNLKNVIEVENTFDLVGKIDAINGKSKKKISLTGMSLQDAVSKVMFANGYDGIRAIHKPNEWYIVLDPKKLTVIGGE